MDYDDAYNFLDKNLINEEFFMDVMTHILREKIPDRIVHPKGNGAFGYFEVTNNISCSVCKADMFKVGKRTPVAVRFSNAFRLPGEADTLRNMRGFGIKFYTEEGNFDIAGLGFPVHMYKNPVFFHLATHCFGRNPVTYLSDANAFWNIFLSIPESLLFFMFFFSEAGIPYSFRHMPCFSIHTYQLINDDGETYFAKFIFEPDQGIKFHTLEKAKSLACEDPDYYGRDLYNAIENRNYPSWTVKLQIFTSEDIAKEGVCLFDVTRLVDNNKYKPQTIGKMVLDKNPGNYFADIEQLAFCPGNYPPGVCGAPDKLFEARRIFYRDAQNYRLKANSKKIRVNRPKNKIDDYSRNGAAPVGRNFGGRPNYFPNIFHGSVARVERNKCKPIKIKETPANNLDQVKELYVNMSTKERKYLVNAIVESLNMAVGYVQEKVLKRLEDISPNLVEEIKKELKRND